MANNLKIDVKKFQIQNQGSNAEGHEKSMLLRLVKPIEAKVSELQDQNKEFKDQLDTQYKSNIVQEAENFK